MMKKATAIRRAALLVVFCFLGGCKREARPLEAPPSSVATPKTFSNSDVLPGPTTNEISTNYAFRDVVVGTNYFGTNRAGTNALANAPELKTFYTENAFELWEGKTLFEWFNCVGCHGRGGGGMGPALIDEKWLYGHAPEEIYASIAQGRPNGMPAFKDRIPEYMIWQLAAYVRSISGIAPMDASPGRSDHIQAKPPENTKDPEKPRPDRKKK
jgi:cytochrome c oxidase cbb3-type subunit III